MTIDLGLHKAHGILESRFGVVCAMDVLGVRQKSKEDPEGTLNGLLELNETFQLEKMEQDWKENRDRRLPFEEEYKYYTTDAKIDLFMLGDTYFIAQRFPCDKPTGYDIWVGTCAILRFFRLALEKGFMMRGAVSIGAYHLSHGHNIVVGQAISDAIECCEFANWIGLHFTSASSTLAKELTSGLAPLYNDLFFEYDVPSKKDHQRLLCIGWPAFFCSINFEDPSQPFEEGRKILFSIFSKQNPPPTAQAKYDNTWIFFNKYRDWTVNVWHPLYLHEHQEVQRIHEGKNTP